MKSPLFKGDAPIPSHIAGAILAFRKGGLHFEVIVSNVVLNRHMRTLYAGSRPAKEFVFPRSVVVCGKKAFNEYD